ncbi:MAG: zinc ribbon domain-containing protein [Acidobacteriaceae bacterium]|nr:zinc ribbon domain-containing protein [Acidobacteriaceae bacterium]
MEDFLEARTKMPEWKMCQSCGMPFGKEHRRFIAKEADGSDNLYCIYCYRDGKFTHSSATVQDMIEMGVPHLAHKIGEQAAQKQLLKLVPTLKRWQNK